MYSSSGWKTLELGLSNAPKLLLKFDFTSSGYGVQLTDISRIWAEKLTKRDIIRRAWDTDSSIDPSEDDEQYQIFVGKIQSALAGEDGTDRELLLDGDDKLSLKLSAPLPKPLPPFTWTVSLVRKPEEVLANGLVIPVLHHASNLQAQVQQLIYELQEKDRVISKITDRLETSGNDLTTVFPGVSNIKTNKKKSRREQLARHVRGLAEFDEAAWRSGSTTGEGDSRSDGPDGILAHLPQPKDENDDDVTEKKWWLGLGTKPKLDSDATSSSEPKQSTLKAVNGTSLAQDKSMGDNEFQRQDTPERVKQSTPAESDVGPNPAGDVLKSQEEQANHVDGDSTTEDEDDLDAATSKKPIANSTKQASPVRPSYAPTSAVNKLGALGGRSSKSSHSPGREATPEKQPEAPKPRSKLGAIGGKVKPSEISASPSAGDSPPETSSSTIVSRKMGVIGGKRKPSEIGSPVAQTPVAASPPKPVTERSRTSAKEQTPPPRETSQERADRKRDELKQELEQKAKAPTKKKRKF